MVKAKRRINQKGAPIDEDTDCPHNREEVDSELNKEEEESESNNEDTDAGLDYEGI